MRKDRRTYGKSFRAYAEKMTKYQGQVSTLDGKMKESELFRVAAYIRLSREDGGGMESNSVKNQKKLLTEYISGRENFALYDIYIEM